MILDREVEPFDGFTESESKRQRQQTGYFLMISLRTATGVALGASIIHSGNVLFHNLSWIHKTMKEGTEISFQLWLDQIILGVFYTSLILFFWVLLMNCSRPPIIDPFGHQ